MKGNKNYFELAGGSNYRGYNYSNCMMEIQGKSILVRARGGGTAIYKGYIGMCRCEGYGFQAVYSGIGYINQSVWV